MRTIVVVVMLTVFLIPGLGRTEVLPKGGGEPGKALMAFLEAANKRDFVKIRGMYPDSESGKITDRELEENLQMFIRFNPAELNITGGTLEGDSATLNTLSHGTITMRRTNGKWLMEQWRAHAEATIDVSVGAETTLNEGTVTSSDRKASSSDGSPDPIRASGKSPDPANEPKDVPKTATFAFDPRTLQVLPEGTGWQVVIVSGVGEKILFSTDNHGEAAKAAEVLKFHGVAEVLEVSMPGVVEYVFPESGKVKKGIFAGEQCVAFDPAALAVTEFKGTYRSAAGEEVSYTQWSVDNGKQMVMRYNEKLFAEEMVSIARKHGSRNRCHVGGFWYLRK